LQDALEGRFGIVITESLDRLSRDQEDIAHIFKRISFAGGRIVTLSEGEINELHIGLKGTMGALYLKDLADKTRRGLRGRVEAGKSGGGNSYGYDVVRGLGPDGQPLTGERRINVQEAAVVRRIFEEYAAGISPRAIRWAGRGGRAPSMATASVAPAFSTTSFISAGWSGTACAT
jgi:site-specific DNA recombinase